MNTIITINLDLIIESEIWKTANQKYEGQNYKPNLTCRHNKFFIDINKIPDLQTTEEWLKNNSDFICYIESNETIEELHRYPRILFEPNESTFNSVSWDSIQKEISSKNFKNYDKYLKIDFHNGNPIYTYYDTHSINCDCYSIALFYAIVQVNKMSLADEFQFSKLKNGRSVFRITINKIIKEYYDISDVPYILKRDIK